MPHSEEMTSNNTIDGKYKKNRVVLFIMATPCLTLSLKNMMGAGILARFTVVCLFARQLFLLF